MSDYINKQDVLDAFRKELCSEYNGREYAIIITALSFSGIENILNEIKTADVVERKRGEWNFEESPDGYYHSECSECGHWFYEDAFLKPYNYCPNCGADMRGKNK